MHLHWFRSDLRIHDNTALDAAASQGPVLALYIITPKQWQQHDDAACKVDLWRRQLIELSADLSRLNIPLLIRHCDWWQDIPGVLLDICQQYQIEQVHCNAEYAVNERLRDTAVQQHLQQQHIGFSSYLDQLLFEPGSITTKSGGYFKVFGQFKRVCQQHLYDQLPQILPAPEPQAILPIQSDPVPQQIAGFQPVDPHIVQCWPAGEAHGWQRLDDFADEAITDYAGQRDFPALSGTSQLSPYLSAGIISIRQCLHAALKAANGELFGPDEGINTWITQLLWREFYQHILVGFPQVSRHQPFKQHTAKLAWRQVPDDLQRWQQGQTGFPLIDAAMRQLQQTGWMHNRLRMIVAMFLSKNLLIDWRLGEQWFMQHLIDGDLAANNGGWQWSASTGTDSVPYFRIFNPITQSQKIDPDGTFIRQWLPELAHLDNKSIHAPHLSRSVKAGTLDYPAPMVDLATSRDRAIAAFAALKN
ncbi:deoxyribodipyrimidine photo-lyase [Alkanindiges illinoisensis]|uniref:Deoxyribodipyrimidine photo-lyase n=1 Tax=Alkanindiges illinoisensis TaxID=197183 RepID=A0A4Y7XB28_9GAMM|nr:deoxyribodipyrimidine photo-lyase [Alkanindiges illinoisensis]TEU25569.1 deoxyribodipyrimidine photo-lyase [Alkanindiges illinoisensis]